MERRVLGKGLSALISPEAVPEQKGVIFLDPQKITANRYQPRLEFKEDKLQELMDSIQEKGVVQPVIVRKNEGEAYELIAGERRLRAVKGLGHKEIPAVIKNVTDLELLELSLIENIQRDDLNALEEAKAYNTMIKDFNFTQEQIAKTVGKGRATVANMLRLLSLPSTVQEALAKGLISFGHAKAILSLPDENLQIDLLDKIITDGYSVREAEQYATLEPEEEYQPKKKQEKDQHIMALESEMQHILGTKVKINHKPKRGKIQIEYYSIDDLQRILKIMGKQE
ncbi:MAG: ParB/RepB/Spo0J family partition protein [PVC group bacterium]|nr:ParB/RepB/Spo0J family partition protein [PVC group bacterium]